MAESRTIEAGTGEWSRILAEARQALTSLRAGEIEDLAARADCMLAATIGIDPIRQRIPAPAGEELRRVLREHRRLGDLLSATELNLKVLRRVHAAARDPARAGEEPMRWVR